MFRRAAVLLFLVSTFHAPAGEPSVFSWVHWRPKTLVEVESQQAGVKAVVRRPSGGKAPLDAAALSGPGWTLGADGFIQTPRQKGGERLAVDVQGLPLGEHTVYVRYFSRPRKPGESWWFLTYFGLGDGGQADHAAAGGAMYGPPNGKNPITLIAGTGGFDDSTVYELRLGTVGSESAPTNAVSLWFERYEWSLLSRIGSIRIETAPSVDAAETLLDNAFNRAMREKFRDPERPYGVKSASATLKVRPKRFDELRDRELGDGISLSAALNERESAQLLLYAPETDMKNVAWEVSPLVHDDGATLRGEVKVAPVGYVRVEHFDLAVNGWWPDPVLDYLDRVDVPRGSVQALWVSVDVASDAVPGIYRGSVTIRPEGLPPREIPIQARVRDFSLPSMPGLRVVMGCNDGSGGFETDYKINPSTIYSWAGDDMWSTWARRGATAINLGYFWSKQLDLATRMPTDDQLSEWTAALGARLRAAEAVGLRDACYVYCFDEAGKEWDPAMRAVTGAFKAAFPDLPIMTTAHRPWTGPGTMESVDWWCPQINHYDLEAARKARAAGKQVWMYVCNNPEKPFPNLRLWGNPSIDHRVMLGFMAQAFSYDGFLYWSTRAGWQAPITGGVYTDWTVANNGDGQLYQCTTDKRPLASVRLENMRDGLEDYDYLALAGRLAANPEKLTPATRAMGRKLQPFFAPGNKLVRSQVDFTQSPEELEKARAAVADFIEAAGRDAGP